MIADARLGHASARCSTAAARCCSRCSGRSWCSWRSSSGSPSSRRTSRWPFTGQLLGNFGLGGAPAAGRGHRRHGRHRLRARRRHDHLPARQADPSRPGRAVVKFVVAWLIVVLLVAPAILVAGIVARGGDAELGIGLRGGRGFGALEYTAVFLALSLVTSRALVVGLAYVVIWEGAVAGLFEGTRILSVRQHALAIADALGGEGAAGGGTGSRACPGGRDVDRTVRGRRSWRSAGWSASSCAARPAERRRGGPASPAVLRASDIGLVPSSIQRLRRIGPLVGITATTWPICSLLARMATQRGGRGRSSFAAGTGGHFLSVSPRTRTAGPKSQA